MKVLALETATEHCSVAVLDGERMWTRAAPAGTAHSGSVLQLVAACLQESGLQLAELDALAFGRGPGAFTGLRLGASVVQGLAHSVSLPVIPVSTLQNIAQQVIDADSAVTRVLVCQDARLQEVYSGAFIAADRWAVPAGEERVGKIDAVDWPQGWREQPGVSAAGSALAALPALVARLGMSADAIRAPQPGPQAAVAARLAVRAGPGAASPATHALPVYLRNDVAQPALS